MKKLSIYIDRSRLSWDLYYKTEINSIICQHEGVYQSRGLTMSEYAGALKVLYS
jgi:hypothetical protein